MSTIVTRAGKGTPLTNNEVDANFTNLNTDKYQSGDSASFLNLAYTGTLTGGTGVVNLGSGQFYKDASGNVGIGTSSPTRKLEVSGAIAVINDNILDVTQGNNSSFFRRNTTQYLELASNAAVNAIYGVGAKDFSIGTTAAQSLLFSTNSAEKMRIDASGNLGLGVTPSAWNTAGSGKAIQIANSGSRSSALATYYGAVGVMNDTYFDTAGNYKYYSGGAVALYQQSAGVHSWHYAAAGTAGNTATLTQAMTLDASGQLIVGGTTALATSANRGNITINGTSSSILTLGVGGVYKAYLYSSGTNLTLNNASAGYISFENNTAERMRIDSAGNVGIGTSSPQGKFNVSAAGAEGIEIYPAFSSTNLIQSYNRSGAAYTTLRFNALTYEFQGSGTERMRIDSSGNLGLGVTPTTRLDVSAYATNVVKIVGAGSRTMYTYSDSGGIGWATGSGASYVNMFYMDSGNNLLQFFTAGTERMRIDASGNLGIGVTPSAWGSNYKAIQFGFGGSVFGRTNSYSQTALGAGYYHNGTSQIYLANTPATQYQQDNGIHYWFNAPSGTAGAAITFTQALTLFNTGGLALGSTVDPGAGNLSVSGSITEGGYKAVTQADIGTAPNDIPLNQYLGTLAYQNADYLSIGSMYATGSIQAGVTKISGTGDIYGKSDNTGATSVYGGGAYDKGAGITLTGTSNTTANTILFTRGAFVESMRIDSSGNLGLGVTPSAWGGSYAALQLKGGFSLTSFPSTASPTGFISSNSYFDGTSWKYIYPRYATRYKVQNDEGAHSWDVAPVGTAGNAITFTQAMTLNAAGLLGIGVTSPTKPLHVTRPSGDVIPRFNAVTGSYTGLELTENESVTSGTYWQINKVPTTHALQFWNGSERMRIDSSGNVGIGTTITALSNAQPSLQVKGASTSLAGHISAITSAGDGWVSLFSGTTEADDPAITWQSTGNLRFATTTNAAVGGFTERMRIDSTGNVGIGTTAPNRKLEVVGSDTGGTFGVANSGNGASILYGRIAMYSTGFGNAYRDYGGEIRSYSGAGIDYSDLRFYTAGGATSTERMRINSAGSVGINTTSVPTASNVLLAISSAANSGAGIQLAYNTTGGGAVTSNTGAGLQFYSYTGAIGGEAYSERMRIDASGNLSLGDSSSSSYKFLSRGGTYAASNLEDIPAGTRVARFDGYGAAGTNGIEISQWGRAIYYSGGNNTTTIRKIYTPNQGDNNQYFGFYQDVYRPLTSSGIGGYFSLGMMHRGASAAPVLTEALRIDTSGNLLVGATALDIVGGRTTGFTVEPASGRFRLRGSQTSGWATTASIGTHVQFYTDNGTAIVAAGSIGSNGSTTSYVTSSDYRLKENIAPMQGALETVAQLKPVTYNWKADGSSGQGFIAHELQAVVPDCVTGEKDAVDEEGKPVYQGIDTSFLVATLTKAIQELNAKVTALEAQLAGKQ